MSQGFTGSRGTMGEFVESIVLAASGVPITTSATPIDVTLITLTAGDWQLYGFVRIDVANIATPSATAGFMWISASSATSPDAALRAGYANGTAIMGTGGGDLALVAPYFRALITSTTTYYLSASANFTAGTIKASGKICARRWA